MDLDSIPATDMAGLDTDKLEIDQLRGRAEVAEQERDILARSIVELRANFRALADSYDSSDPVEAATVADEIRRTLDAE